ncbi:MAG: hypothetical protein HYX72_13775 [Acidobacteria bacterium]|nr:hypothetical protein [Acidobacteriota bacterium]
MNNGPMQTRILLMVLFSVCSAAALFGQSVADLARQERERVARQGKPAKVYTNDDIQSSAPTAPTAAPRPADSKPEAEGSATEPAGKPGEEPAAEDKTTGAPAKGAEGKPGEDKTAAPPPDPEKERAELEKQYRDRFAKLRESLAYEEKKLDVLQRELNLAQTQFYSDPNAALREQTFRTEINQRTQEIERQRATVANAKQAIADLEEELRKKGLPPGWAR